MCHPAPRRIRVSALSANGVTCRCPLDCDVTKRKAPVLPCRLCGTLRALRESHIIPEFMYKPLYGPDHRAMEVLANRKGPIQVVQKGYREHLLCQSCETRLSGWETPSTPVWREAVNQLVGATPESIITVRADYRTFKLFSLSLLWRASVAEHDNFSAFDLGPLEPTVREMLLTSTPGAVSEFQSLAVAPANLDLLRGVIGPCGGGVWHGLKTFRLSISGIQWLFFAEPNASSLLQYPAVTHAGFTVLVSRDDEQSELIRMFQKIPRP
jgi:hypothetical protein